MKLNSYHKLCAITLLFSQISVSACAQGLSRGENHPVFSQVLSSMPVQVARVSERFDGDNAGLQSNPDGLILIPHRNNDSYRARNELKMLDLLIRHFPGIRFYVSGASGNAGLSHLRHLAGFDRRLRVANAFLNQNKISAIDWMSLVSERDIEVFGMESRNMVYKIAAIHQRGQDVLRELHSLMNYLKTERYRILRSEFSEEFLELTDAFQDYEINAVDLIPHAEFVLSKLHSHKFDPSVTDRLSGVVQELKRLEQQTSFYNADRDQQNINANRLQFERRERLLTAPLRRRELIKLQSDGVFRQLIRDYLEGKIVDLRGYRYFEDYLEYMNAAVLWAESGGVEEFTRLSERLLAMVQSDPADRSWMRLKQSSDFRELTSITKPDISAEVSQRLTRSHLILSSLIQQQLFNDEVFEQRSDQKMLDILKKTDGLIAEIRDLNRRRSDEVLQDLLSVSPESGRMTVLIADEDLIAGLSARLRADGRLPFIVLKPEMDPKLGQGAHQMPIVARSDWTLSRNGYPELFELAEALQPGGSDSLIRTKEGAASAGSGLEASWSSEKIRSWLQHAVYPSGFPKSYDDSAVDWKASPYRSMDINERKIIHNASSIYDSALWQIALTRLSGKHSQQAQSVTDTLISGSLDEFRTLRAHKEPFRYGGEFVRLPENEAYFFRMISARYEQQDPAASVHARDTLLHSDWVPATGEQAWAAIIGPILSLGDDASASDKKSAADLAVSILPALRSMQTPIGCIYHVPHGTFGKDPYSVSNENNLSVYAALRLLLNWASDNPDAFRKSRNSLDGAAKIMRGLEKYFRTYLFNSDENIFYKGGRYFDGQFYPDSQLAVDVQAWAVLAIGPDQIDRQYGRGVAAEVLLETIKRAAFYNRNGSLAGLGFSEGHQALSVEWTAAAVMAIRRILQQGYLDTVTQQQFRTVVRLMVAGINDFRQETESGLSFRYADDRHYIPFGWWSNNLPSIASTCWVTFMKLNYNPLNPTDGRRN